MPPPCALIQRFPCFRGAHHLEQVAATVADGGVACLGPILHKGVIDSNVAGVWPAPRQGDKQQPESTARADARRDELPHLGNGVGAVPIGAAALHLRLGHGSEVASKGRESRPGAKALPQTAVATAHTRTVELSEEEASRLPGVGPPLAGGEDPNPGEKPDYLRRHRGEPEGMGALILCRRKGASCGPAVLRSCGPAVLRSCGP